MAPACTHAGSAIVRARSPECCDVAFPRDVGGQYCLGHPSLVIAAGIVYVYNVYMGTIRAKPSLWRGVELASPAYIRGYDHRGEQARYLDRGCPCPRPSSHYPPAPFGRSVQSRTK
eukprot:289886-Pleurochrysis_carterae.AAC.1